MKKSEITIPLGDRVLIRKDESKKVTSGGIVLPDSVDRPNNITGIVISISAKLEHNSFDFPVAKYQRVLFNPRRAIPVSLEDDCRLFIIPVEDVVAAFSKEVPDLGGVESDDDNEQGSLVEAP